MSTKTSSPPKPTAIWLRSLAIAVLVLGIAAERGRVFIEASSQCIVYSNGPLHDRFGNLIGLPVIDPFYVSS